LPLVENPQDWLLLARERLTSADALFQALGTTLSGIELLQEAVERFLKGYLISKGWELQKIHNLSTLLDHAISFDKQFISHADLCDENLPKEEAYRLKDQIIRSTCSLTANLAEGYNNHQPGTNNHFFET
jgi:HEPN domain-containing protein